MQDVLLFDAIWNECARRLSHRQRRVAPSDAPKGYAPAYVRQIDRHADMRRDVGPGRVGTLPARDAIRRAARGEALPVSLMQNRRTKYRS